MNSHITLKEHSMIVEAAALLHAYASPYSKREMIPNDLYKILESNNVCSYMLKEQSTIFVMFEMLLDVKERKSLVDFNKEFNGLKPYHLQSYLLHGHYSKSLLKDINTERLTEFASKIDVTDFDMFMKHLIDPKPLFDEMIELINIVYKHPSFKAMFTDEIIEKIQIRYNIINEELSKRHPLSLSQSQLGKSFYNISDWNTYEFLYVYSIYPYKLRVHDENRNIMLMTVIDKDIDHIERFESIKQGLKIISDPNRMSILRMIYSNPMFGKEIAKALSLTTATVSHHLDLMRKEGLIHEEREKNTKYFSTNQRKFDYLMKNVSNYIKSR